MPIYQRYDYPSIDFLIEVQKGNVPGHSIIHKFGQSTVGTTLVPVTEAGFYRTPTVATTLEFVSDNINDTALGSGARQITYEGLNENWAKVQETIATDGTSAVALPHNLTRLFRWFVSESGTYADQSNGSHAGNLTIRESGAGDVWSQISNDPFPEAQSEIGVFSGETGKTYFVLSYVIFVDSSKVIDVLFFRRDNINDITAPYTGTMRLNFKSIGVTGPIIVTPASPIGGYTGPVDLGFMAKVASATADISVDYEILEVENSYLNS